MPYPDTGEVGRILVPLDSGGDYRLVLRLAVRLAARLGAGIMGVFVEDLDLLRAAGLPGTREVMLWTATERPLSAADAARALRVRAARIRAELALQAQRARVDWSFQTIGDRRVASLVDMGGERDVLFILEPRSALDGIVASGTTERVHDVLLVYTGSTASERALAVATALVQQGQGDLLILVPLVGGSHERELRAKLFGTLHRRLPPPRIVDLVFCQRRDCSLRLLSAAAGRVAILPADLDMGDQWSALA